MSNTTLRNILIALVVTAGLQGHLVAATVAVGPPTCQSTLVHFLTIGAAVSSVPAGSTILVCPGTYPEQVTVSQPLTLRGVTDGTGDAAVITAPGGGLVQNATSSSFGPVAVQLLVANTVLVTVQNIVIDGTGGGCPVGANRIFGLYFLNVGMPVDGVSAGKILDVVVRNQRYSPCGLGEGIGADTSFITITANEVHDIDRTSIIAIGGRTNISNNNLQNTGNGILLEGTSAATVASGNIVSNVFSLLGFTAIGVWVESGAATVSKNTVATGAPTSFGSFGIYLDFDGAGTLVTGNKVNATFDDLYLFSDASTTVQSNTFSNAASDAIVDDTSAGGSTVTNNMVNEAPFGILRLGTSTDIVTPNSYFNVGVTIDPSVSRGTFTASP